MSRHAPRVTFREVTDRNYVDGTIAKACTNVGKRRVCATGSAYGHGEGPAEEAREDALARLSAKLGRG